MLNSSKKLLIIERKIFNSELQELFSKDYDLLQLSLPILEEESETFLKNFLEELIQLIRKKGINRVIGSFILTSTLFERYSSYFHKYFKEGDISRGLIFVVGRLSKNRSDWIANQNDKEYFYCNIDGGVLESLPILKQHVDHAFLFLTGIVYTKEEIHFEDLNRLIFLSHSLAQERNFSKLLESLLDLVVQLASADGGSIYLVENVSESTTKKLVFQKSYLKLSTSVEKKFSLAIDQNSIAGYVAYEGKYVNIPDVHNLDSSVPYTFNSAYDKKYSYYTKSILAIPLINKHTNDVIGVIQLINRKKISSKESLTIEDMKGEGVIPFSEKDFELAFAVACQATIVIQNQILLGEQRNLFSSFIQLIAEAIDFKSKHTGKHCRRVPEIVTMLIDASIQADHSIFKDFVLNDEEIFEVQVAAWLHDCGKMIVPNHIMDKATKLNLINDEINEIILKIELSRKDAKIRYLEKVLEDRENKALYKNEYQSTLKKLEHAEIFLCKINIGSEFLEDADKKYLKEVSCLKYDTYKQGKQPLLTQKHFDYLSISRGTLSYEERLIINSHMVSTVNMLDSLPFPSSLGRVPEYASGHHEKFDGTGYPKGIFAGDMSIPARILAVADVFEALTSAERPYKQAKTLSESMEIMGKMKETNHLDPDIFDLFISSGIYLQFSKIFLPAKQIDKVNEKKLLSIKPNKISLPDKFIRDTRKESFLPQYQRFSNVGYSKNVKLNFKTSEK